MQETSNRRLLAEFPFAVIPQAATQDQPITPSTSFDFEAYAKADNAEKAAQGLTPAQISVLDFVLAVWTPTQVALDALAPGQNVVDRDSQITASAVARITRNLDSLAVSVADKDPSLNTAPLLLAIESAQQPNSGPTQFGAADTQLVRAHPNPALRCEVIKLQSSCPRLA